MVIVFDEAPRNLPVFAIPIENGVARAGVFFQRGKTARGHIDERVPAPVPGGSDVHVPESAGSGGHAVHEAFQIVTVVGLVNFSEVFDLIFGRRKDEVEDVYGIGVENQEVLFKVGGWGKP